MSIGGKVNFAKVNSEAKRRPDPAVPFSTTLMVRDCCLCLHLQRAARAMARRFDLALKPTGLTNGQFSMLMSLNRTDRPEIPLSTIGSTAELLGMDRTTVTAAARVLARRGWMKLEVQPTDRRNKVLKLTAKGMKVLAAAVPIWTREHAEVERAMGTGAADRLRKGLALAGR
jgi:DNA-binding MarR family transcriptional regulator